MISSKKSNQVKSSSFYKNKRGLHEMSQNYKKCTCATLATQDYTIVYIYAGLHNLNVQTCANITRECNKKRDSRTVKQCNTDQYTVLVRLSPRLHLELKCVLDDLTATGQ